MMERQVLSEPFEVLAFDLVGPFPKGKGGYMYVLTVLASADNPGPSQENCLTSNN